MFLDGTFFLPRCLLPVLRTGWDMLHSFPKEPPGPPELQPLCPMLPWSECWLNTSQVSKWDWLTLTGQRPPLSLPLGRPWNASLPPEHGLDLYKMSGSRMPSGAPGPGRLMRAKIFQAHPYDSDLRDLACHKALEI